MGSEQCWQCSEPLLLSSAGPVCQSCGAVQDPLERSDLTAVLSSVPVGLEGETLR
jgi:hypothetical protein